MKDKASGPSPRVAEHYFERKFSKIRKKLIKDKECEDIDPKKLKDIPSEKEVKKNK